MSDIVQKLWGFCHTLRHDGVDYGDYIEQLTYLLFLKMADEKGVSIPLDIVGFNYNTQKWPAAFHKKYPKRPIYGSETSSARAAIRASRTTCAPTPTTPPR